MEIFRGKPEEKLPPAQVRSAKSMSPVTESQVMTTTSPAWAAVVDTVENAATTVKEAFTVAEDATAAPSGGIMRRLQTWWEDASGLVEDARNTVGEKIAEMQIPDPIPDDPLNSVRQDVTGYLEILKSLRDEIVNFAGLVDAVKNPASEDLLSAKLKGFNDPLIQGHWTLYKEAQVTNSSSPQLIKIRNNLESSIVKINTEVEKLNGILVRFRRRDKLYNQAKDLRVKINKRKEKQRKNSVPDTIISQELFSLATELEDIKKEFSTATETVVAKANELLPDRSLQVQSIILDLLEQQRDTFTETAGFAKCVASVTDKLKRQPASQRSSFVMTEGIRTPEDLRSPLVRSSSEISATLDIGTVSRRSPLLAPTDQ